MNWNFFSRTKWNESADHKLANPKWHYIESRVSPKNFNGIQAHDSVAFVRRVPNLFREPYSHYGRSSDSPAMALLRSSMFSRRECIKIQFQKMSQFAIPTTRAPMRKKGVLAAICRRKCIRLHLVPRSPSPAANQATRSRRRPRFSQHSAAKNVLKFNFTFSWLLTSNCAILISLRAPCAHTIALRQQLHRTSI